uniref:Zinc finger RING-type eukaryotic domain-containing protein n=1 Tax=Cyprinodon variegatus TaxID=28743 RepID=A0A3Q2DBY1_CYPVA
MAPRAAAVASVSYLEDLTCSVCLNIFTDPVNLPCGHSFHVSSVVRNHPALYHSAAHWSFFKAKANGKKRWIFVFVWLIFIHIA